MLASFFFYAISASTSKTWCIYNTLDEDKTKQVASCKEMLKAYTDVEYQDILAFADAFTADNYKVNNAFVDTAVIFSEKTNLDGTKFAFLLDHTGITNFKVHLFGIKLNVDPTTAYDITDANKVPDFNCVFAAGKVTSSFAGLTADQISKFGTSVATTLAITKMELNDQSTFPSLSLGTGGSVTEFALSHKSNGNSIASLNDLQITYGSLILDMSIFSASTLTFPSLTFFHCDHAKETYTSKIKLGLADATPKLIFDESFTLTDPIFTLGNQVQAYVPDETQCAYLAATLAAKKLKKQCLVTVKTDKPSCTGIATTDTIDISGLATHTLTEGTLLSLAGDLTLTKEQLEKIFVANVLSINLDQAGIITQVITSGATTEKPKFSLKLSNYRFSLPAASKLLASEEITFDASESIINPNVVKNSDSGIALKSANGFFIDEKTNADISAATNLEAITNPTIETAMPSIHVTVQKKFLKIGDTTFPHYTKYVINTQADSKVTLSLGADVTTPPSLTINNAAQCDFDSSFNSFKGTAFIEVDSPVITTKMEGKAPWLTESSYANGGTVTYKPDPIPKEPSSGLPGGAIAGIVIACVVVVAAIVVVVLNATGVIHLCGKKKVEV